MCFVHILSESILKFAKLLVHAKCNVHWLEAHVIVHTTVLQLYIMHADQMQTS